MSSLLSLGYGGSGGSVFPPGVSFEVLMDELVVLAPTTDLSLLGWTLNLWKQLGGVNVYFFLHFQQFSVRFLG